MLDLEEVLGGRMFVWLGAIALALAGIFLVKYTVDQGLLSPPIRIALGVLFGVSLLGGGEWLRRESLRIAEALSAAGIAVLFASFLAATNLYDLLPDVVGFALMALTAATAVGLSLRQGKLVAFVGLVGGFMTPYLIQADSASGHPAPLFTYLLLLQVGLVVVTRRRGWDTLVGLTLAAGQLWVLLWLSSHFSPEHASWLNAYLLASAALFLSLSFARSHDEAWSESRLPLILGLEAVTATLVLMSTIGAMSHFQTMDWLFLGLLGASCLVLARRRADYEKLPWLVTLAVALLLLGWSASLTDVDRYRFLGTVLGFGALFAGGAYVSLWGSARPAVWSALAAISGVGLFVVGFVGEEWLDGSEAGWFVSPVRWGVVALALAVVAIAAAMPLAKRRKLLPEGDLALAVMAAAATGFLSGAVTLELHREWLAVGWALEVAALAWIALRLQVPVLRRLAWPLGILVAARLLLNPGVLNYDIGTWPVLNWLVYGYGIPAAALGLAAWYGHRAGDVRFARAGTCGALLLGWVFLTLEVRQFFHPGHLTDARLGTRESSVYGTIWLAYGLALLATRRRWPVEGFRTAGRLLTLTALTEVILMAALLVNPLWSAEGMGAWPVLNWLLVIYGLPAALGLAVVAFLRRTEAGSGQPDRQFRGALLIQSLILAWVCVSLEVRQLFHESLYADSALRWGTPLFEHATFAVVWLVCAGLLFYALRRWRWEDFELGGWAFLGLGLVQAFSMVLRLALPILADEGVGSLPIVNHLLYLVGLPALLCFWIEREVRHQPQPNEGRARLVFAAGMALAFSLVTLEVRQLFHGNMLHQMPLRIGTPFFERASYAVLWMWCGAALLYASRRWRTVDLNAAGRVAAALGLLHALVNVALVNNPAWSPESVGSRPILNGLVFAFGLTALAGLWIARELRRQSEPLETEARLALIGGLLLSFTLVSLEVRQLFHGAVLSDAHLRFGTPFLERASYAVLWLWCGAGLLYAFRRWRVIDLDAAGWVVAGIGLLHALVNVTLLNNPVWSHESVGDLPLLNGLLFAYGLTALACLWIARELRRQPTPLEPAARLALIGGLLLGFALVSLEVRQLFHGAVLSEAELRFGTPFLERASYAVLWLWCGAGLLYAFRRWRVIDLNAAGWVVAGIGLLHALVNVTLLNNPVWTHESVGDLPLLNGLLFAYGLTAIACLWIARELRRQPTPLEFAARIVSVAALLLCFVLVSLEVRQLFHGTFLDGESFNNMERYAYSLAWVLFGTGLLVTGINRQSQLARYGSLAVMLLAVGKVFLYDTQSLGGLYRVFSFLGLGLCLLFLAWLYQRFVFRGEVEDEPAAA